MKITTKLYNNLGVLCVFGVLGVKNAELRIINNNQCKSAGVIQGFWSLNPCPSEIDDYIKNSPRLGFKTYNNVTDIINDCEELVTNEYYFLSTMLNKPQIGKYISIAAREKTDTAKAEKFIELLKGK
ncbi:MAG: hypothetical protein KA963_05630 [Candidatus Cloacimonas sp.]|jgi:hypothetical protein|uniref:Uncharacterized protein n=1 Tax=Cloacimonas acidaminovorans (strain Evry) TaxID=459349 RepID=B0VIH7_CLOAI|nr:hypothetical protein [Candidatus Cloacimonas acidaminovorans]MBP7334175.1 hypothetical protein [Candidatus Cloacimonas sp.]NLM89954.1 hypothetical protein [Candidatus Cloacimonadota bacterium]HNZ45433.1 hypothetical protein [Candidatus Syntrophosphaera thermopropionivorans]CAO81118.1 hypothetical protein CLOAM1258 [Candidatus Cloacimonas acidaminovorans str. Evry]HNV63189.1 hypothetical protein [Candidatus Cloacimonas acidaminovorans]